MPRTTSPRGEILSLYAQDAKAWDLTFTSRKGLRAFSPIYLFNSTKHPLRMLLNLIEHISPSLEVMTPGSVSFQYGGQEDFHPGLDSYSSATVFRSIDLNCPYSIRDIATIGGLRQSQTWFLSRTLYLQATICLCLAYYSLTPKQS